TSFSPCPWLYLHLGRLYDVKTTGTQCPSDEIVPEVGGPLSPYRWLRMVEDHSSGNRLVFCEYRDADLLPCLKEDKKLAARIEKSRKSFFDLKLSLLATMADALKHQDAGRFWSEVVTTLKQQLNAQQAKFWLATDRRYLRADTRDSSAAKINLAT